jgi:Zn-dependent protease/CBS domain-containing protein
MSNGEETQEAQQGSSGSLRIATIAGIPVRVHFTFLLVLGYFAYLGQKTSSGWLPWVLFALALFACVILHEFGHALMAKRFGIKTRDITLYPMGGVAMFEGRMKPNQELWIALAGPMVNIVLSVLLGIYFVAVHGSIQFPSRDMLASGLLPALFMANIGLAVFNLLPAFPMDGGRVLRAFLALITNEAKATAIAGGIGQVMAILLALFGFASGNFLLVIVSLFVFMGAGQEVSAVATRSFLEGHKVRDAMQVRFRTISSGATMAEAADALLAGSQHDFPVLVGEEIVGLLTRTDIARGLASDGPAGYVAGHMHREFASTTPELALEEALELFNKEEAAPIIVMENGGMVGMLTQENLSEFIMLQSALRDRRSR